MKQKRARFLSFLLLLCLLARPAALRVSALEVTSSLDGALLYTLNEDGNLEYNATYENFVSPNAVVVGCGLESVDDLAEVLGEADAPERSCGTDVGQRTLGMAITANLAFNSSGEITVITVTAVSPRPTVGISWKSDSIGNGYRGFAQILERNGACAVYLPQITDAGDAREILSQVDGIFVTGGSGWNPGLYGEFQTPHGSAYWNDVRDTSDLHLLQQAIEMDIPLLAVCRGTQGLNIAMGGGLIQDIPYYLGQKVQSGEISTDRVTEVISGTLPGSDVRVLDYGYSLYDENYEYVSYTFNGSDYTHLEGSGCDEGHLRVIVDGLVHGNGPGYHKLTRGEGNEEFVIDTGSKWLYDILGRDTLDFVASSHHQAVNPEKLGEGITIAARSSDGVVEAIEHKDSLFALGLQWHPEKNALKNPYDFDINHDLCNAPLRALVEYAGICAQRPEPQPEPEETETLPPLEETLPQEITQPAEDESWLTRLWDWFSALLGWSEKGE